MLFMAVTLPRSTASRNQRSASAEFGLHTGARIQQIADAAHGVAVAALGGGPVPLHGLGEVLRGAAALLVQEAEVLHGLVILALDGAGQQRVGLGEILCHTGAARQHIGEPHQAGGVAEIRGTLEQLDGAGLILADAEAIAVHHAEHVAGIENIRRDHRLEPGLGLPVKLGRLPAVDGDAIAVVVEIGEHEQRTRFAQRRRLLEQLCGLRRIGRRAVPITMQHAEHHHGLARAAGRGLPIKLDSTFLITGNAAPAAMHAYGILGPTEGTACVHRPLVEAAGFGAIDPARAVALVEQVRIEHHALGMAAGAGGAQDLGRPLEVAGRAQGMAELRLQSRQVGGGGTGKRPPAFGDGPLGVQRLGLDTFGFGRDGIGDRRQLIAAELHRCGDRRRRRCRRGRLALHGECGEDDAAEQQRTGASQDRGGTPRLSARGGAGLPGDRIPSGTCRGTLAGGRRGPRLGRLRCLRRRLGGKQKSRRCGSAAKQCAPPFRDRLRSLVRSQAQRMVDGGQERRPIAGLGDFGGREITILDQPQRRLRRRSAADQAVECRAERVDVAPRPLHLGVRGVLLGRRVADLDDRRHLRRALAERMAGRAEIEQHRRAVMADIDVVGGDVAMQQVAVVQQRHRVEQIGEQMRRARPGSARGQARPARRSKLRPCS